MLPDNSSFSNSKPSEVFQGLPTIPLLIVEEEDSIREALSDLFSAGGYEVTVAYDCDSVLRALDAGRFSLVISGLNSSEMDGPDLLAELLERDPYTECILLARSDQLQRLPEAFDSPNLFTFFWKPLSDLGELVRSAARAVERREFRFSNARLLTELRDQHSELAALRCRLEQLDRASAISRLVRSTTNDMEQPFSELLSYADYLRARLNFRQNEAPTSEQVARILDYLTDMESGIYHWEAVVEDLKDYIKDANSAPAPTDLNGVVQAAVRIILPNLESNEIKLETHLCQNLPPVLADSRRLRQVFVNLLMNAQQAIGNQPGIIQLLTRPQTDADGRVIGAIAEVHDSGSGIPDVIRPFIFEPFFTTRPREECLGIGLTIARRVVREVGGEIEADDAIRTGACLRLLLPTCDELSSFSEDENEKSVNAIRAA